MLRENILKISKWIKKNSIIDLMVFGSAARGSLESKDMDLCILIHDSEEKNSLDLVNSLSETLNSQQEKYHINILTVSSFLSGNTLSKTLLTEGFSLKHNKKFSEIFNLKSKSLFRYSLKHYTSSKRVRFHYLLKGRYGTIGILKEVNGHLVSNGVIIIPTNKEDLLKGILDQWQVSYKITRILSD